MLPWSVRLAGSMLLLRASRLAAALARRLPAGPPADLPPACLPDGDPDPGARAARAAGRVATHALVPVGTKYALTDTFDHLALAELPAAQRYPARFAVPKRLLAAALSVDLRTGAPPSRPDTGGWLGVPRAAALGWDGDAAFAPLRVQGPNPAWIRRAAGPSAPPLPHDPGRVYAVDYLELLRDLPTRPGRFLAPCAAVFADEGGLRALGVWIDTPQGRRWVPADASARWARARRYFHSAELHVHEAVSHFLWTHVVGEKVWVATLRRLDEAHPVRRLLAPHFEATLQANENSGRLLIGPGGFFERCFSAGWTGIAELLRRGDRAWRYERTVLPRDLAERGVLELSACPYRDDALPLWEALARYTAGVVAAWYADDGAIAADPELAAWSAELHGWLGDRGFPRVAGRDVLAEVLTAALFNVVQHTFVNALQYEAYGAPGAWPASLSAPFDADEDGLPVGVEATDAVRATFGFSIQYNTLGDGLLGWHGPRTVAHARALVAELARLDEAVAAREGARPWPYGIARPARISNSINA